jgi:uncharacterized protein
MKRETLSEILVAAVAGGVFGIGLAISGMSNPAKVLAFLDLAGPWDPSLALVMAGAIAVGAAGFAFTRRRTASMLGLPMRLPTIRTIDRRLVLGATVFGIGWGLVGLCPGPAVVALGSGAKPAWIFFFSMLAGMALHELTSGRGD